MITVRRLLLVAFWQCGLALSPDPALLFMCPKSFAAGVEWDETAVEEVSHEPCSGANSHFSSFTRMSRYCSLHLGWRHVDFSSCTLQTYPDNPFLLLWGPVSSLPNTSELTANLSDAFGVQIINTELTISTDQVSYTVYGEFGTKNIREINVTEIDGFWEEAAAFLPSDTCECGRAVTPLEICSGVTAEPCVCTSMEPVGENCTCQSPFVGDGKFCTLDNDQDGFPDRVLRTCTEDSTECYCQPDNCPTVHNPQQNINACVIEDLDSETSLCMMEVDDVWSVQWGFTTPNITAVQSCGVNSSGFAARYCDENGFWEDARVDACESNEFRSIREMAEIVFSNITAETKNVTEGRTDNISNTTVITDETIALTLGITEQLATATGAGIREELESILPRDLSTANYVLNNTIDLLIRTLGEKDGPSLAEFIDPVVDCLNNILAVRNSRGWTDLQQTTVGSQALLDNAERFGIYLAYSMTEVGESVISRENIVIRTTLIDATTLLPEEDQVEFSFEGLVNFSGTPPTITIPRELLIERQTLTGMSTVPVVNIAFQHLQNYLTDTESSLTLLSIPRDDSLSAAIEAASSCSPDKTEALMVSSQVAGSSSILENTPVQLNFTIQLNNTGPASDVCVQCVFWDFSDPIGTGGWSEEGLTTDEVDGTSVTCSSNHLTSFAVLVDVAGPEDEIFIVTVRVSNDQDESEALLIVSYIGCAISLTCLVPSIIFFLSFGKALFQQVNQFVHLNLAIALFVGYLVFSLGIELGTGNEIGCKAVTVLLQYFFLAAFCWMLCEGIMLYLKLVVVFSSFIRKWWIFFILGWGTPLIFVIIGISVFHEDYAVYDYNGDPLFCWISPDNEAIWIFVAPMLLIIVINSVFLVLVLFALLKVRKETIKRRQEKGLEYKLVLTTVKGMVVLLPLLGLTWVFGLFAVNENTTVFAWLFTIFNSLQGLFFFIFHVLRSEQVWGRVKKKYFPTKVTSRSTSGSKIKHRDLKRETMMSNNLMKQSTVMDLDSSVAERVRLEDHDISMAGSTDMLLAGENKQDPLNGMDGTTEENVVSQDVDVPTAEKIEVTVDVTVEGTTVESVDASTSAKTCIDVEGSTTNKVLFDVGDSDLTSRLGGGGLHYTITERRKDLQMLLLKERTQQLKTKIEHLLGVALSEDTAKPIIDDVLLCNLINKLHPGMITMIQEDCNNITAEEHHIHNIVEFISACRNLGVPEDKICSAGDILEQRNPALLIACLEYLLCEPPQ